MGKRAKPSSSQGKTNNGIESAIWIALIGAVSTIVIALINSQTIIGWLLRPTPTPTATSSPMPVSTDRLTPVITPLLSTNIIETTIIPTSTEIGIASPSATQTQSLIVGMHVQVYADKTIGKAPLRVKLDARDSFLQAPGGQIYKCRGGACNYTWEVYAGGQRLQKPERNSSGTFQYAFGKKGSYVITVVVCRGGESPDCNSSAVSIEAR